MKPYWLAALALLWSGDLLAQSPSTSCDTKGIGAARLDAGDGSRVAVESVTVEVAAAGDLRTPYCLVKLRVPQAIRVWVGLPLDGRWNGRWQSVGGGVYAGTVAAPVNAVAEGYAAATTDTGHEGGRPDLPVAGLDGSFGMLRKGEPNASLQADFAWRSEHLMAVLGKQLVQAFYGAPAKYAYWNGCSTGGRQGLRMAQDFPADYDGVLAGAPAIHWDRFQAGQIWYPLAQLRTNGGPIGGGDPKVLRAKEALATRRAVASCDALDGVTDGVLDDPRKCSYSARADEAITRASCRVDDAECLTPGEAAAIDTMWDGPKACASGKGDCKVPAVAERDLGKSGDLRLWYASTRGTDLSALGGPMPMPIATEQPKYWVYFDPAWDWHALDFANYLQFFRDTVARVGPMMASDNPDLSRFRDKGGKLLLWHGYSDPLIAPGGTIDYYDAVARRMGGGAAQTQRFARLFMAPGVGHCAGGEGPQPQGMFDALVAWVERGKAPDVVDAKRPLAEGAVRSRPLCPYPAVARWSGRGSTDDAANFSCVAP